MTEILGAMNSLDAPNIYPVHPRNRERASRVKKKNDYTKYYVGCSCWLSDLVSLIAGAKKIVTNSGGVQREVFFASKQCVTVFDHIVWSETMISNRNQLASPDRKDILYKLGERQIIDLKYSPFGNGHASDKIVEEICLFLNMDS